MFSLIFESIILKILTLFLTPKMTLSDNYSNTDKDLVEKFEFSNFKFSPLPDLFPVIFHLKFKAFEREYSIIFAQTSEPKLEMVKYENFFRHYKSVSINVEKIYSTQNSGSVYQAECSLFISPNTYDSLINNMTFDRENPSNNFGQVFHIDLLIRKKKKFISNELWVKVEMEKTDWQNGTIYQALRAFFDIRKSQNQHRPKRSSKYKLIVETCVLIDYTVYELFKNFLQSNDINYLKMYFDFKFSQIIFLIDHIYKKVNTDFLEIEIKFIDLFINEINDFDYSTLINSSSEFLAELSKRTFQKDTEKYKSCDHLFFIHSFRSQDILGFSKLGLICSDQRISSILYGKSHFLETVMAHELAHNFGVNHDNVNVLFPDGKKRICVDESNLMSKKVGFRQSFFMFSNCSIQSFENNLLNPQNKSLFDFYKCLIQNNPSKWKKNSKINSMKKMPGHFFSLSDQCRYFLNFSKSYYCRSNIISCHNLFCYNRSRECENIKVLLLDGSVCGENRTCVRGSCTLNHKINHLVWQSEHKRIPNIIENGIINLRQKCPGGASLEKYAFNNKVKYFDHQYTKPCDQILYGNYQIFEFSLVHLNLYLRAVCCEAFLKSTWQICGGYKHECRLPPCEYYPTNPCFNNGKCVNFKSNLHETNLSFGCECPKGFKGPLCMDVDPCALNPCNEGELCVTFGDQAYHTCLCPNTNKKFNDCYAKLTYINGTIDFVSKPRSRFILNVLIIFLIIFPAISFFIFKFVLKTIKKN